MKVYLGGPINGCSDDEANGWRQAVIARLVGHSYLDPMRRDYRGREMEPGIAAEIVAGDLDDIDQCDVCLFNCPKPSYGTAMEIFYASQKGKKVIVIVPQGPVSPWLLFHATDIYHSLDDALAVVG